ncbi:uncharacterized protein ARMOST_19804 [Armillaria ostoyae]|uniref:CCHC-type domain-containing protein n=1 Tax=Armillaria ostoyae TaxID=47428 RepID=A0A284S5J6_ARMOS|nr:uncharacterized protein ARMOST_19804 [Armillaria ostoyae]
MTGHDMIWDLNQPSDNEGKGKKPDRGRPPIPNYRRPLFEWDDRFSVPRLPPSRGRPHPMPQPVGHADADAAYLGIKPILMQPPKSFKGAHNNIKRFIGDCITYFKAFAAYFLLDSQTVPFTASYFKGPAKEWWVYKRPEFWANDDDDPVNPAIEIVHERKMFEVCMGKNPALQFFYKLEKEAKLAGRRSDETERGTLIAAVRRGLPESYTTMIANIGRDIPQTYPEWKARILVMYDKQQKNYAFDQHLNHRDNCQPYKGTNTTATSNNKAGGMTSSSSAKPTSSAAPLGGRDSQGRWLSCPGTMFGGAGAPMDIGQMRAQGLCFRCHKKGHLTTSCLPTHSDIPASNFTTFNISRTTSTPVLESQNRYAALSVEECNDNDNDNSSASDTKAEQGAASPLTLRNRGANRYASSLCRETQSAKAFGKKSPTIMTPINTASFPRRTDGTWAKLKYTPCEVLLKDGQAALTRGSPITTASVEPRPDGALEKTTRNLTTTPTSARAVTRPRMGINRQPLTDSEGTGQTGNSTFAVQAPPITLPRSGPLIKGEDDPSIPPLNGQGRSSEGIPPRRALATGKEAASAQAVQRGHSVTLIEVPDQDDDTAFQIWLAKEQIPAMAKKEATSDEPAQSSAMGNERSSDPPTKSDPSRWYKPFEVDWTLCTVCEARNDNAAVPELTEELLSKLHQGGERAQEQLYEFHEPPRYLRRRQSSNRDLSLDVQLNPCTGKQTLVTKALIDSGCTSSSIN